MKIAILTEILSIKSGSRAPIELAKSLASGNNITLIAFAYSADQHLKKELDNQGVKVVLMNIPKVFIGKWLAALKMIPYLRTNQIISFHGTLPSFIAAKLSLVPIITTYYGTQLNAYYERLLPNQTPKFKDKILNFFVNQLTLLTQKVYFNLTDKSVAISKYTSTEAQRLYGKKIPHIYLGASSLINDLYPKPYTLNPIPYHNPTILSISRLTPYKGFHLLIEAIKKIGKKVNLIIVGSAPNQSYFEYLNKIKTPQTKIFVDISDSELAKLYQTCDIYASCDRYLFFGLPILEAALFAKPSVVINFCAAKEIIKHKKTGFVAQNLTEFTKYLEILIDKPNLQAKMGNQAKIWVQKNFSWKKTAQRYQNLFNTILSCHSRASPCHSRPDIHQDKLQRES